MRKANRFERQDGNMSNVIAKVSTIRDDLGAELGSLAMFPYLGRRRQANDDKL